LEQHRIKLKGLKALLSSFILLMKTTQVVILTVSIPDAKSRDYQISQAH